MIADRIANAEETLSRAEAILQGARKEVLAAGDIVLRCRGQQIEMSQTSQGIELTLRFDHETWRLELDNEGRISNPLDDDDTPIESSSLAGRFHELYEAYEARCLI